MIEAASSDVTLVFEVPGTLPDNARMTNGYRSDGASTLGRQDKIAGTTEVGVGKSVSGGLNESRRGEILLNTMGKDLAEDAE
jgi:hypothetical protein